MQRYQQAGLLRISPHLELAPVIKLEMKNFQATISPSGHETMAARTGTHDDLLQALSLAMHHSLHYHPGARRQIPYQEFEPAPLVPGTAPKVFGLDPDMGPAEELPVAPEGVETANGVILVGNGGIGEGASDSSGAVMVVLGARRRWKGRVRLRLPTSHRDSGCCSMLLERAGVPTEDARRLLS